MLILSIMLLLSSNAVSTRRDKSILYARDAIIILILCFLLGLNSFFDEFHGKSLGLYHGLFHTTTTTHVFHLFIFFISALILQFNAFYSRKLWHKDITGIIKPLFNKVIYYNSFVLNKMSEQYRIIEYPLVILFVITGGVFLVSSSDLISVFLSIELQSYGLYILCSMYRNSEKATTAGLTYFLLGGLSSCFILLGSALLYGNSGNTAFDSFYIINNISNSINYESVTEDLSLITWYNINYIHFSLVIMSVGFLFKVTAAPFHFWSPDVYDSIPTIVTTFVAIFAKISIFILLLELVHYTNSFYTNQTSMSDSLNNSVLNFSWTFTILLSSLLSLIIGSVMGLTQFRIKRLFAYSTISHVGFILLALSINSIESIQSFLFYLMQYSLSNLNAFAILITMGYSLYLYVEVPSTSETIKDSQKDSGQNVGDSSVSAFSDSSQEMGKVYEVSDRKNSPIQLISQIKGYFYINPVVALSFGITIFSFVGIPPLVGFFAKQMVLSSALDNGYVFMSLVAILTSVISAYYYLALIKNVFFEKSDYKLNPQLDNVELKGLLINRFNDKSSNISFNTSNISISGSLSITISILTLAILLFILNPQEWLSITNILSIILFNC